MNTTIQSLRVKASDILIVEVPLVALPKAVEVLKEGFSDFSKEVGVKVIIVPEGMKITVLRS